MKSVDGELIKDMRRGEGFIREFVERELDSINAAALTAIEKQESYTVHVLPDFFDIPYMDPKDSRNRVYFNIMRDLEKRKLIFKLIKPKRWCKICTKPVPRANLIEGTKCGKCHRETFIPRGSKYKIVLYFKSQEEKEENENIAAWLDKYSI